MCDDLTQFGIQYTMGNIQWIEFHGINGLCSATAEAIRSTTVNGTYSRAEATDETKAVVTYPPDPVLLKLALFGRICGFETIYCSWTKKFSELNGVGNLGEDAARAIMECHPSS
ncbi:hypothetical protein T06_14156 [Trichinella sp. T6]|nr:hypothetical protein T06_3414 [Trichinella sp. T6]KRX74862.1 hypothetical protein T06_14156 [Trichinella sp. T6]